jgi:hypothetical protein|tara:strand:+ start:252 stop:464 length:213 start_codon:yes stop_codon:yes gene_type:complete
MVGLFSIIRNIGFRRTSEAFLFGAIIKDCVDNGVDLDTTGGKLLHYMDTERLVGIARDYKLMSDETNGLQ